MNLHRFFARSRSKFFVRSESNEESSFAFGFRLSMALATTLALIGILTYVEIDHRLEHRTITNYSEAQQADVKGFEDVVAHSAPPASTIAQIGRLLDAIARRPGTEETLLINQQHIVVAAGEHHLIGTTDSDPRIDAALLYGRSYAGHEGDPSRDRHNFEFVMPVDLPSGRYAYELSYSHSAYDKQLSDVLSVLIWVGVLALFGGAGVFYLVGGRALMRDHRLALQRATRDGLTDLPNHRAFQDDLQQAVASAARYQNPLSLAVLDVDDFKLINDRHGHPHGDEVLQRVASALREGRPGDRPYRIGGDEFALLLAQADAEGVRVLARRLSNRLAETGVQISIGVSTLRPGQTADALRAEADAALYEAKRQEGASVTHFEDVRERVALTTSDRREAVHHLIEEQRLTTVFQPIWDLKEGTMLGLEALTRPDPSYGLSGPAEAFDIAEQIGRVHQLDMLCVESALRVVPRLAAGVLLFINLAPQTLDLDAEGNDWLLKALEQAGLPFERVVVEVTERFGGRTASVVKCLRRLREQGLQVALDDVGTGNSGLEMLSKVGANFVKIDQSIVTGATTEPGARAVLMAMAMFARQTGAFVIAEGIEDQDTLEFLRAIDEHDLQTSTIIQGGQGFQLGHPSRSIPSEAPSALHEHLTSA